MPRDFQVPFSLPNGASEIVLVRHGSAPYVPDEPWTDDGQADANLSELGERQAQAVAQRLVQMRFGALFVTPLRRTQQTAAPLAEWLGMTPVVAPELREVRLGEWEGHLRVRAETDSQLITELFRVGRWDVIPGAEDMDAFSARIGAGLDRVADAGGEVRRALAFVHAGVIAEACRRPTDSRPFAFLRPDNGSITRLMRLASGRWELVSFNETAHLEGVAALAQTA